MKQVMLSIRSTVLLLFFKQNSSILSEYFTMVFTQNSSKLQQLVHQIITFVSHKALITFALISYGFIEDSIYFTMNYHLPTKRTTQYC